MCRCSAQHFCRWTPCPVPEGFFLCAGGRLQKGGEDGMALVGGPLATLWEGDFMPSGYKTPCTSPILHYIHSKSKRREGRERERAKGKRRSHAGLLTPSRPPSPFIGGHLEPKTTLWEGGNGTACKFSVLSVAGR